MVTLIKNIIKKLPFNFSKNHAYDRQTVSIIKKVCKPDSNCIDVGCHKGEVLDIIRKYAPVGTHFGFEPIPMLFEKLEKKYINTTSVISNIALSNKKGSSTFNYVVSNPAYSGLVKRKYDKPNEVDQEITVQTDQLDNVLDENFKIDLIKIDVEGGELLVLEGATETIKKNQPVIIFEHGLGASEFYNSSPEKIFELFKNLNYQISLMERYLKNDASLSFDEFKNQFYSKLNYYFIAYPKS